MTQSIPLSLEPKQYVGVIQAIESDSLAAAMGLQVGDEILRVNGQPVEDVIDVQFYAAEDEVTIEFRRADLLSSIVHQRSSGQSLGITFTHPTFDIDIRRCNNLCPFCFVLQTAPRMRRMLYIKDDDYRYSFLYGHFVTLTNLNEHDWWRIEHQRLSPLYVSVHSTDVENRRACLANPTAPDVLAQLRWLAERGIETHTQLVVTPELNDGAYLEKSLHDLAALYPAVQSVSVVPVGLTKHHKYGHRAHTREEAAIVLENVQRWQKEFLQKFGARFAYLTDEWYLVTETPIPAKKEYDGMALEENGLGQVRNFLDEWRSAKREIQRAGDSTRRPSSVVRRQITLVTASLFAPTLAKTAQEFATLTNIETSVIAITNERLGHGITVAGLLMGQDVIDQLHGRDLGTFLVLPRVMFDHPQGISLDDVSPLQIAKELNTTIYLADSMGDVWDAVNGKNALRINPDDAEIPVDVMKAGGWAVEKYL